MKKNAEGSFSEPFIRRPVATTLLMAALILSGLAAFTVLPVAPLPQIDFPTISVSAQLPGASPDIMGSSVATPLERQFGHIAGITEMTSSSSLGSTSIALQFDLNRDINGAARDVEAAINAARSYLPSNLPSNPSYRKVNPADAPILILALTSNSLGPGKLYDAASTIIQQKLSQIDGVGQVIVGGSSLPAVRVEANPMQLSSYGITLAELANTLSGQNANVPKGFISDDQTIRSISANDQLLKAELYKPLIIGYHNGAAVRLSDVAEVDDSVQNLRAVGYLNGKPAVMVIIYRSPGANIIDTVHRIQAAMPSLKASIPGAIDLTSVFDRTMTIQASVHDVETTLLISVALVILVTYVFLRDARATLIPSIAVPASLIGTFGAMYLLGFSLNNLTLMALTISTGFVVDDAIVVLEDITRYLEEGMEPMQAALKGAKEIGFTVLSISISLVAVFIPILMMGGIVGRLFREFAVTLSVAILVSLVISLTATPMMCSRLLKRKEIKKRRIERWGSKILPSIMGWYERSLKIVLRHPWATFAVFLATMVLNVFLIVTIPKGFFPEQDNGSIYGGVQGTQGISFQEMNRLLQQFVKEIKEDPGVKNVVAFTGGNGSTNQGFMYLALKPLSERKLSSSQIIDRLRPTLTSLPGATVFLQAGQDVRIGGRLSNAQYQYTIQSDTTEALAKWGPTLLDEMKKLPELADVNTDQQNNGLDSALTYDRQTASRLGITPQLIDQTLYDAFGQALVSTMYTALNQYYVVLEVAPPFWQSPLGFDNIYLQSATLGKVPLRTVLRAKETTAPLAVNHQGQFPSVTVSFNLKPGVALSDATEAITAMEQKIGMPTAIHGMFSGTLEAFEDSLSNEFFLIITALMAVYIVLGILYESFIHPLTILSTLPSAGVGAVLALLLFKTDLSIVALIGMILLIGIVKKNAILMIDFALAAQRRENTTPDRAIYEACLLRFRPILMTTLAALFGAVPLAFGTGAGSELRRPLGIAIIGGLIFSQLLTLYTTPVVYLLLDRLRSRLQRGFKNRPTLVPARGAALLAAFAILFSSCVSAPKYERPQTLVPETYKEIGWKVAEPKDDAIRPKWWESFNDPGLNALEEKIDSANPSIASAYASFQQAQALVKVARAQYFPTLAVEPSFNAQHGQGVTSAEAPGVPGTYTTYSAPLDASWAPDLWGKVRSAVEQNTANAQLSAADLENVKLEQHAMLATDYWELRAQDELIRILNESVAAYQKTYDLTTALKDTGIDSDESVAQTQSQLESVKAQAMNLEIARAQYEHAIAVLIGKLPAEFNLPAYERDFAPPYIPVGVPSKLLERRPDIAAAERAMAAMNAQIGIAKAAYYPNLTLNGGVGFGGESYSTLLAAPSFIWSLGASLSQLIFDGGARAATVDEYQASYKQAVASYRLAVLTAFQQVEDQLASLRVLDSELKVQDASVSQAERAYRIAFERYRTGLDPYLNVITAQTAMLTARQTDETLKMQRMTSSVSLIEALGGGWDVSKLPK